ncbi:MAG: hypothetical protein ACFFCW_36760, partial [Candidatus Hodarchaeota archaeon]
PFLGSRIRHSALEYDGPACARFCKGLGGSSPGLFDSCVHFDSACLGKMWGRFLLSIYYAVIKADFHGFIPMHNRDGVAVRYPHYLAREGIAGNNCFDSGSLEIDSLKR